MLLIQNILVSGFIIYLYIFIPGQNFYILLLLNIILNLSCYHLIIN